MASTSRTPRKRPVRVDVAPVTRRSSRVVAVPTINAIHPATPQDRYVVTRTEFDVDDGTQQHSSAYQHALEDSETDALSTSSAMPASPGLANSRRKTTPSKRKTPVSATRRATSRRKAVPGLELSDEDSETMSMTSADDLPGRSRGDSSSVGFAPVGRDEPTTDEEQAAPDYMSSAPARRSNYAQPASPARRRSEGSFAALTPGPGAPLSPIAEESSPAYRPRHVDPDGSFLETIGDEPTSVGGRVSAYLSYLWWLVGSRLYLLASTMLCWDVWLIVSIQQAGRFLLSPVTSLRRSSSQPGSRQMSPLLTIAILLLFALLIFFVGSKVEWPGDGEEGPGPVPDLPGNRNHSNEELRSWIAKAVAAEFAHSMPTHLDGHSKKFRSELQASIDKVQDVSRKDKEVIDKELRELLRDHVMKMNTYIKTQMNELEASVSSRQDALVAKLAELSAEQQRQRDGAVKHATTEQLEALESQFLEKLASAGSTPAAKDADEVMASLRQRQQALEALIKTVDARSQGNADSLSAKSVDLSRLLQRLEDLSGRHGTDVAALQSEDEALAKKLAASSGAATSAEVDVDVVAAGVARRLASDDADFAEMRQWLDGRYAKQSTSLCASIPDCKKQLLQLLTTDFVDLVKQEVAARPAASSQEAGLDKQTVSEMIDSSLDLYAADRVGRYDFALETQGGQVYVDGTSPSFDPGVSMKFLGFSLFSVSYSPRLAISSAVLPGNCWPFAGQSGHITLILSAAITVTHVTIDHAPVSLTTDGSRTSAPNKFTVVALENQEDKDGTELLSGAYDLDQQAVQTFAVTKSPGSVRTVRFNILSNHGSPTYTCLYRLRVHGTPAPVSAAADSANEGSSETEAAPQDA